MVTLAITIIGILGVFITYSDMVHIGTPKKLLKIYLSQAIQSVCCVTIILGVIEIVSVILVACGVV